MNTSQQIQEHSASEAREIGSVAPPTAKRPRPSLMDSEANIPGEIPYDTDEDENANERAVSNSHDATPAAAVISCAASTVELPDLLSRVPTKEVTMQELNAFVCSNMGVLKCWIHVKQLPRADATALGTELCAYSIYTFVDGDLRWTRHLNLKTLKEVFSSVQRTWYREKESHAPIAFVVMTI